jgi:hypothetical protein
MARQLPEWFMSRVTVDSLSGVKVGKLKSVTE